jgi:alkanesulfonate monooxygenase SsuD/methylene tetrahydromethanopterin reductase-like flavin-dependent oxidoreductase (luciferase family)
LTLREVVLWHARPRRTFVGTAEQLADEMERWFEGGATEA